MFEESSWIDAVHLCSDARGYWWSAITEVDVFNAESCESLVSHLDLFDWWTSLSTVACSVRV
jgi:hypothetical protein